MFGGQKIVAVIFILFLFSMSIGLQTTRAKGDAKLIRSSAAIPGRYIVVFDKGALADAGLTIDSLASQFGGTVVRKFETAINGFSVQLDPQSAEALSQNPLVRFVEEDSVVELAQTQPNPDWGLDRSDQRKLPLDHLYGYGSTGSTVDAYVLDTGIRMSHAEFGGRASLAFDAIGDGNGNGDCHGHGTHVAGIIGSATYGVAKNVRLYSARVLNCAGSGQISDVIAAVDWITEHRSGPSVANLSMTAPGESPVLEMAIENSIASGVVFTIAAGNSAWDACAFTPARTSTAITVAATASDDARARYSNHGPCVDIFAPGDQITSAGTVSDTATRVMSGTSMAAPHVAGAIALYLESRPNDSAATVTAAVVTSATEGLVGLADTTSNLLLYAGIDPAPCDGNLYGGTLPVANMVRYFPDEDGERAQSGRFEARLRVPGGVFVYNLALERKQSSQWIEVASGVQEETVVVDERRGTYRWRVEAVSGGGNFALCALTP